MLIVEYINANKTW